MAADLLPATSCEGLTHVSCYVAAAPRQPAFTARLRKRGADASHLESAQHDAAAAAADDTEQADSTVVKRVRSRRC